MRIKYLLIRTTITGLIFIIFAAALIANITAVNAYCADGPYCVLTGFIKSAQTLKPIKAAEVKVKVNKKNTDIIFNKSLEYKIKLKPGKNLIEISSRGYEDCTFEIDFASIINHENIKYKNIELTPEEQKNIKIKLYDRITAAAISNADIKIGKKSFKCDDNGFCEITFSKEDERKTLNIRSDGYKPYKTKIKTLERGSSTAGEIIPIYIDRYTFYNSICGVVAEQKTHEPIYGAIIELSGIRAISDAEGKFILESLKSGKSILKCSADGYESIEKKLDIAIKDNKILIYLKKKNPKYNKLKQ